MHKHGAIVLIGLPTHVKTVNNSNHLLTSWSRVGSTIVYMFHQCESEQRGLVQVWCSRFWCDFCPLPWWNLIWRGFYSIQLKLMFLSMIRNHSTGFNPFTFTVIELWSLFSVDSFHKAMRHDYQLSSIIFSHSLKHELIERKLLLTQDAHCILYQFCFNTYATM